MHTEWSQRPRGDERYKFDCEACSAPKGGETLPVVPSSTISVEDVVFHSLFIGATGAGKTNTLLYWLGRLSRDRRDVAFVLIDPHGDAAVDQVRAVPKAERARVTILDPTYVSFGLNPLSLPQGNHRELLHEDSAEAGPGRDSGPQGGFQPQRRRREVRREREDRARNPGDARRAHPFL
jgi:hypothetical protein